MGVRGLCTPFLSTVMVERFEKFSLNFSILLFVVNVILVPLWFIIISLVFFYHCQGFLSGFLQFSSDFVNGHNILKYRNCAPLKICIHITSQLSHALVVHPLLRKILHPP